MGKERGRTAGVDERFSERVRAKRARGIDEAAPDAVICRLCSRAFRTISFTHLRQKHHFRGPHPVEEYKRRYGLSVAACRETRRVIRINIRGYWTSQGRRWTALRIVEELRRHAREGGASPARLGSPLKLAIHRHYGSWDRAMVRAGLRPDAHRLQRTWDDDRLATAIRARHAAGQSLVASVVMREDTGLHLAAARRHRSWGRALVACGFDAKAHRAPAKWTEEAARRWILEAKAAGRPYTAADAPRSMHTKITRAFEGGWAAFVASLGIPYEGRTIKRNYWTKDVIVREVRRLRREGTPLYPAALAKSRAGGALLHCGRRVFGTWDDTLRAAGVDPTRVRLRRSLKAPDIAVAIEARRAAGQPLEGPAVAAADYALMRAATRIHGTWENALEAAKSGDRPG